MIQITRKIALDDKEVSLDFVHASGPGGQNVNKVSTAVQLRFDVINSPSLPEPVKARLIHLAGRKMSGKGILIIHARRYRTQDQNRKDAFERLTELIRSATRRQKKRRLTTPTKASNIRRLEGKSKRSHKKKLRKRVNMRDENG